MRIWNEPESAKLEAQTLEKLSLAPWRLLRGETGTNAAATLLRPLLDDAVREESYLEVNQPTNGAVRLAFAIRLDNERAALWETNLAAVLESLTGIHPVAASGERRGWSLKKHHPPDLLELTRVGEWTIFGAGYQTNQLLADFVARLERGRSPFVTTGTNFWLEANVDLKDLARVLKLDAGVAGELPRIYVRVLGDGENVYSRGDFTFAGRLPLALEPWILPTNLIRVPVGSFTAVRGLALLLATNTMWTNLRLGPPPNEFYAWAGSLVPWQTYFASPAPDSSNRMSQLADALLQNVGPWLTTNRAGMLERSPDTNGVVWSGLPFISPCLRSEDGFLLGGFFPNDGRRFGLPPDLLRALSPTNLVYYDWELTGPRIEGWFRVGQLLRLALHKAQLPAEGAASPWLVTNITQFGNSVTTISQTGPDRLSFVRRSSVGFTAIELHLLADWLESPEFPLGLYTFLGPPEGLKRRQAPHESTNAPPASPK